MLIENKLYTDLWENPGKNDKSKLIPFCNKLLILLSDKEKLYINQYYWVGKTEEAIVKTLGLKSQQAVSIFKKRVFAKIRMYSDRQFIFQPFCTINFDSTIVYLQFFYRKFVQSLYINKLTEERSIKHLMSPIILNIINYLDSKDCNICAFKKECMKKACSKHIYNIKRYPKSIYQLEHLSILNNKNLIKKTLQYLIDWRIYE